MILMARSTIYSGKDKQERGRRGGEGDVGY